MFSGICFGKSDPYSYREAKRVIRLAMDELRSRQDLQRELGIDQTASGRGSITGRDGTSVWDFLWLINTEGAKSFTKRPHLTVGIHSEYLHSVVIIPNGMSSGLRQNILAGGIDEFRTLFGEILVGVTASLRRLEGAIPSIEVIQRRYPFQRAEPFVDAKLEFDLRTGFGSRKSSTGLPKFQPEWLDATYHALASKNSNMQLAVGAKFFYDRCDVVRRPEILDHIASVWIACKPLLRRVVTKGKRI